MWIFLSFSIVINVAVFGVYSVIKVGMVHMETTASMEAGGLENMTGKGLNCPEDDGKVTSSDDTILSQLVKLQMVEGLPWADDSDVCKKHRNMSSSINQRVNLSSLKAS